MMIQFSVFAEDWPRWRGPRGDGTWKPSVKLAESWPDEGLRRVWKQRISPGYSGVSVSGGRVFVMDRPDKEKYGEIERVLCLDAKDGRILWNFSYPAEYKGLD